MAMLRGSSFEELTIGQRASYTRTVSDEAVRLFAAVSGDVNPVHLDEAFAATTSFKARIAHGMFTGGLISAAIALELPGPGSIYIAQELRFERPVRIGDTITVELTITEKHPDKKLVRIETIARNQLHKVVVSGAATVLPPAEPLQLERPSEPRFSLLP